MSRLQKIRWKLTLPMIEKLQKTVWPDEPDVVAAYKRHLIERLRRDRLGPSDRRLLCQELEVMWFPTKALKQARRNQAQMFGAGLLEAGIKKLHSVDKLSVTEAKLRIDDLTGHSTEAIEHAIKRARRKARGAKK